MKNKRRYNTNSNLSSLENDPVSDDIAFVEKYLNQQMKGQMPDGADGKKVVYLTVDDGPSETVTPLILDTLKAENVHATKDAEGAPKNAEQLKQELIKSIQGKQKAVVLMHDTYGKGETAKALPEIIKYLKEHWIAVGYFIYNI